MPLTSRYRLLALLLIIFISYAAFNAHAASHTVVDPSGCELCAGHGDPSHAIPLSPASLDVDAAGYIETEIGSATRAASPLVNFRQRAPPFPS